MHYGVTWFILNLSSFYKGDRYLAPHSILTSLNRGSTPKRIPRDEWKGHDENMALELYPDRDVLGELIMGFQRRGISVIAYLAADSPAMLKTGESQAYDYDNKSPYVDSCAVCPGLTQTLAPFCACAPSVRRWINHVRHLYNDDYPDDDNRDDDNDAETTLLLQRAFADIIVDEYAERYGGRVAGYWIDQAPCANVPLVAEVIRRYHPHAALAFNRGRRLPLTNNSPPHEDFTFGYPFWDLANYPGSHCRNFIIIPVQESTVDGYYYSSSDTDGGGTVMQTSPSLGHAFYPLLSQWSGGEYVWSVEQASEWQARFMSAGGAWTWSVRRGTSTGDGDGNGLEMMSMIAPEDVAFLQRIYAGLGAQPPYQYECDWTPSAVPSEAPLVMS